VVESCNIINFNFYNLNLLVHGTNPLHMLGGVVRTGMRRDVVTRDTHDATTWPPGHSYPTAYTPETLSERVNAGVRTGSSRAADPPA
jgi:hypothetical protein